jgi:hypothetical protein
MGLLSIEFAVLDRHNIIDLQNFVRKIYYQRKYLKTVTLNFLDRNQSTNYSFVLPVSVSHNILLFKRILA